MFLNHIKQQVRCLSRSIPKRVAVLESFWDRVDGIGDQPYGGYHWFESFHYKSIISIRKKLSKVDVILEIRDARVPFSSYNQELEKLTVSKPKVIIFNRAELADTHANKRILDFYEKLGIYAIMLSGSGITEKEYTKIFSSIMKTRIPTYYSRRDTVVLVIGMPNVGKSFVINKLRRHFVDALTPTWGFRHGIRRKISMKIVKEGGVPGITRKIGVVTAPLPDQEGKLVFIDTPGILSPRLISPLQAKKLSMAGLTDFSRTKEDHLMFMAEVVYATIVNHGLELGAMTMFRMPYPVPKDFTEFSYRAALTMNMLRAIARDQLPFYNEETFKAGNKLAFNIVAMRLIDGFKKGSFGRITLDQIPEISDGNYETAPPYIRKCFEAEQKMRGEREEIMQAIRYRKEQGFEERERLVKKPKPFGGDPTTATTEDDEVEEKVEDPNKPLRVWNIKSKTIDSKTTAKHRRYKLSKIDTRLRSTNEPLSRLTGPLAGDLSEFETTSRQDNFAARDLRRQAVSDKMQAAYWKVKKGGKGKLFNFNPEKRRYPRSRDPRVEIRTFADPNAYNVNKGINIMTGEPKVKDGTDKWNHFTDVSYNVASGA